MALKHSDGFTNLIGVKRPDVVGPSVEFRHWVGDGPAVRFKSLAIGETLLPLGRSYKAGL